MRPMICWSDLNGVQAGVWGLGVEGHANLRRLAALGTEPVLVDDQPLTAGPGGRPVMRPTTAGWPRSPPAMW